MAAQRAAATEWRQIRGERFSELKEISQPTLVVNGHHDVMIPTINSYTLSQHIPRAQLIIYPDSGHGVLFQFPESVRGTWPHVSRGFLKGQEPLMPMIDVYAPNDLLPSGSDRRIGEALTLAALRAEGVAAPSPYYLENTGVFIHRMDPETVQTAAEPLARGVRIQFITPPGALTQRRSEAAGQGRDWNHGRRLRRPDTGQTHVGASNRSGGRRLGHWGYGIRT